MQGIGFMFSSGDDGDELEKWPRTSTRTIPTSDPWVTAVGGTRIAIGMPVAAPWQTGWGTQKWDAVGQRQGMGPVVHAAVPVRLGWRLLRRSSTGRRTRTASCNEATPGRAVPDMALDGDPDDGDAGRRDPGVPATAVVGYGEYRIGGTSLSSPLFAGVQALAAQAAGGRLGFANPTIYAIARDKPGAFGTSCTHGGGNIRSDYVNGVNPSDGIVYSARSFDQDTSLRTKKGWDDVTGVGTPTAIYPQVFADS